jgi:hemerythrin HHE cation binding domain-containing protein
MPVNKPRRGWLQNTGLLVGGIAAVSTPFLLLGQGKQEHEEEEVSPAEDLMREHGVLKRVLLIYREIMNRIDSKREFPPDIVLSSAKLIRAFVEDYHEKLEEDYLFPRFRKANKLVDLVEVLNQQHQKGRILTDQTMQLANGSTLKTPARVEIFATRCTSL